VNDRPRKSLGRPRIRSLKPEAWQDERLGRVSREARLLWTVLITFADDEGRFRALPAAIIGHGFPYDVEAFAGLQDWITELDTAGLLVLYDIDGVRYGCFPRWSDHQSINRGSPSLLPSPPFTERSVNGQGTLTERSRGGLDQLLGTITGGSGSGSGSGSKGANAPSASEPLAAGPSSKSDQEIVKGLFDLWRERCGHDRARLTRDRAAKVKARLREGYTPEEIGQAIDGAAARPFVKEGHRYDDLELICRNGSKLEDFMARAGAHSGDHARRGTPAVRIDAEACPPIDDAAAAERWEAARAQLQASVDEDMFGIWLADVHAHRLDGDTLVLGCPPQLAGWIAERAAGALQNAAGDHRVVRCTTQPTQRGGER
jgi:hypothetical protein